MKNRRAYIAILLLVITSLACSQLTVVNQSPLPASIQVNLPDGASHLVYLAKNASQTWFSFEGGAYQVSVVATDRHIQFMQNMRDATVDVMLGGEAKGLYGVILGPDADPVKAFTTFVNFGEAIEGEKQGVTCTGELPFADLETFEFDLAIGSVETETVVIGYNEADFAYTCQN